MARMQRIKGKVAEREVVQLAGAAGLAAERTWQTAQARDPAVRNCDVKIAGRYFQVKRRARGFKALYDAIRDVEGAFLRDDGGTWLVVLPAAAYLELLKEHCYGSSKLSETPAVPGCGGPASKL